MALTSRLNRFLELLGFVILPKKRVGEYLFSRRLRKIVSRYDIDCVVDVGANVGQYGKFLRNKVGYRGLIISFEPDTNCFAQLTKASQSDPNWEVLNCALGQQNTTLELNLMKGSDFNSFLQPDSSQTSKYDDRNVVQSTVEVPVERLDGILPRYRESHAFNNVFLKLDTQGFDLEVFRGTSNCLQLVRGIQTEISVLPIYQNMPSFQDSLELFRANNFEVSGLYAVSETRFPHAIEFDCILLPK